MDQPEQAQNGGNLEELLRENLEVAKENNKILKRMQRNALLAFIAKVAIWLILLGVPLFFLGPYLRPLFSLIKNGGTATSTSPNSVIGVPSADEVQQLIDIYSGK